MNASTGLRTQSVSDALSSGTAGRVGDVATTIAHQPEARSDTRSRMAVASSPERMAEVPVQARICWITSPATSVRRNCRPLYL